LGDFEVGASKVFSTKIVGDAFLFIARKIFQIVEVGVSIFRKTI
jgi:hypothetical protein